MGRVSGESIEKNLGGRERERVCVSYLIPVSIVFALAANIQFICCISVSMITISKYMHTHTHAATRHRH